MAEDVEKDVYIVEEHGKYQPRMRPNIPGRLKYGRTFLIGLAFFACSFAWSYYNFMMPLILRAYMEAMGLGAEIDVLVGVVMVLDNIVAIFLLPVFGALSDRVKSKLGKRTPFILIGSISAMIAYSVIGFVSNSLGVAVFWGLIMVIMWYNISMAFFRSPAVALMPDLTDPAVRSTGNAIINLMGAVAMVFGLLTPTISKMLFGDTGSRSGGFYIVSIITMVGVLIFYLTIHETPTGEKLIEFGKNTIALDPISLEYLGEKKTSTREPLLEGLKRVIFDKNHSGLFMLLVIFTWFFGYNAINTFYSTYASEYLLWSDEEASSALALAPMAMIVTAIFAGKIAEWIGRRKTIFIGIGGLTTCFVIIWLVPPNKTIMTVLFIVVGIFYGLININTIVIIWELAPKDKVGSYTGAYYFFSQLSDSLSPVVAGGIFSLYKWLADVPQGQQYILLFPYAIICEILAIVFLSQVRKGESQVFLQKHMQSKE